METNVYLKSFKLVDDLDRPITFDQVNCTLSSEGIMYFDNEDPQWIVSLTEQTKYIKLSLYFQYAHLMYPSAYSKAQKYDSFLGSKLGKLLRKLKVIE